MVALHFWAPGRDLPVTPARTVGLLPLCAGLALLVAGSPGGRDFSLPIVEFPSGATSPRMQPVASVLREAGVASDADQRQDTDTEEA